MAPDQGLEAMGRDDSEEEVEELMRLRAEKREAGFKVRPAMEKKGFEVTTSWGGVLSLNLLVMDVEHISCPMGGRRNSST